MAHLMLAPSNPRPQPHKTKLLVLTEPWQTFVSRSSRGPRGRLPVPIALRMPKSLSLSLRILVPARLPDRRLSVSHSRAARNSNVPAHLPLACSLASTSENSLPSSDAKV